MTISLDKKQVHLGWEVAVAIVVSISGFMWGAGAFTTKYLQRQEDIYKVVILLSKDNPAIKNTLAQNTRDIDSIKRVLKNEYVTIDPALFYIEIKKNGHTYYKKVAKP